MSGQMRIVLLMILLGAMLILPCGQIADAVETDVRSDAQGSLLKHLDAPLLFVKRHAYMAGHIYDDYITWHPGGGIYVVENPQAPAAQRKVRAVIDPNTPETLGEGVYRDPELSWDAKRIVFAFKGTQNGSTSIYEIGVDGRGLKQLTFPQQCSMKEDTCRIGAGHHDITPCYLADGRIVFSSTRPEALVPCFNSGVDTLHVMNPDGSNLHAISVNNVNEFDPAVMSDGRILFGRWEYVDKTALYMQSLWTMSPDGRMEEALFANNLAKPTAVLDARPVPGSHLICAALTPHNGQSVGAIVMIDPRRGKNDLETVFNFTPEYPVEMDQGLTRGPSDPWAISTEVVLMANNAKGHGVIQIVDRSGRRELVHAETDISCYSPMLVTPRVRPAKINMPTIPEAPGRFMLVDIYQGLEGVEPGSIKKLRIVEETARTSGLPPGGRWWNQAFLVSWQGAYIVKNILGTVPVHEDGSAYFEVPAGRAVYFEALDENGYEVQRMRTFVQAAPGTTRSCVGCHENKQAAPRRPGDIPMAMLAEPAKPRAESWGSGFIDYPTMVQPVLDKHCVRCHGGEKGFAKGLDFSGGWTWAFNISYETLIKHRLVGYLNCNNGSVHTSKLLRPRTIGSGGAPLAKILVEKHPELSRAERDLMLAWMDTNSNYYGTWDYTPNATCNAVLATRGALAAEMQAAGCVTCHAAGHIGNDWVNLQTPEFSRILRAPMAKSEDGLGVAMCRNRKARTGYRLIDQGVQPPDVLYESKQPEWDPSGQQQISIDSTDDAHYRAMLAVIRKARAEALARPRVDMPGAEITPGECRLMVAMPVPDVPPVLGSKLRDDLAVELAWQRTADVIGLEFQLHRATKAQFSPDAKTLISVTTGGRYVDPIPPAGKQHYALVVASPTSPHSRSRPSHASIDVPKPTPPPVPDGVSARALSGEIVLSWQAPETAGLQYDVFRTVKSDAQPQKLNAEPLRSMSYQDIEVESGVKYEYSIAATDRRGQRSPMSDRVTAMPLPEIKEPVFTAEFGQTPSATLLDGKVIQGKLHGGAKTAEGALELGSNGFASFEHLAEFDLSKALSVTCWLRMEEPGEMPVILSCGAFNQSGWFIQRYGAGFRWHLGGVSCDGGRPAIGRWTHLVATFNGNRAILYQDGKQVASVDCHPNRAAANAPLIVGQYSSQGPQYQVTGQLRDVRIYRRVLRPSEVSEAFQLGEQ